MNSARLNLPTGTSTSKSDTQYVSISTSLHAAMKRLEWVRTTRYAGVACTAVRAIEELLAGVEGIYRRRA